MLYHPIMSRNVMIPKTPSERILISRYNKDSLLLNTLQRNKYSHYDIKQSHTYNCIITSLQEYEKANQPNVTMFNSKNEENKAFRHQYSIMKKVNEFYRKKGKNVGKIMTLSNFNDILTQYHKKGSKIPKVPSTETNNLFQCDPLLTTKARAIKGNFGFEIKDLKIGLVYLRKLREIITLFLSTDKEDVKGYFSKEDTKFYGDMFLFASLKEEQLLKHRKESQRITKENQALINMIQKIYSSPQSIKKHSKFKRSNSLFNPINIKKNAPIVKDNQTLGLESPSKKRVVQFKPIALGDFKASLNNKVSLKRVNISNIRKIKKRTSLDDCSNTSFSQTVSQWGSYQDEKDYLEMAYHLLLKRGIEKVKPILNILLKKFKKCTDEDVERTLSTQDFNVSQLFDFISNLQTKTAKINLPEKISQIYAGSKKKIEMTPKLERLSIAEREIKLLSNKLIYQVKPMN